MSNEQKLVCFMKKYTVSKDVAYKYLSCNDWSLEQASTKYENDNARCDPCGKINKIESKVSPKAKTSLQSIDSQGNKGSSSDQDGYFAGSSASSELQNISTTPSKRVQIDESTPALTTVDSERSQRAWGQGVRLGSAQPINLPPSSPRLAQRNGQLSDSDLENEHTIVVLHLWSEGFSLDDGSLRPYELPQNQRMLYAILRGDYPQELRDYGRRVELNVQDHSNQTFRHLSRKQFLGTGHLLGSPTPAMEVGTQSDLEANDSDVQQLQELSAERTIGLNKMSPMTTVQLHLADGSRITARFNLTHNIGDLYRFVRIARPEYAAEDFVLLTSFPRQELQEQDKRTLSQADLKNVVIIQRIN